MEKCVIKQSHKRLLEAHRLWHQAYDNYFDPEGFRTNINATIQAIRNITFSLQAEKGSTPDFDKWYSAWQEKMKKDKVMSWISNARTDIVHKKDFEMYSYARITIFHYIRIIELDLSLPLFIPNNYLIEYLKLRKVIDENMVLNQYCATIKRQWRINEFPDYNILDLLAYAIGMIYIILDEAHQKSKITIDQCDVLDTIHPIFLNENNIPKCMVNAVDILSESFSLADYIPRTLEYKEVRFDPENFEDIKKHYKKVITNIPSPNTTTRQPEDPFEYATFITDFAKGILQNDGFHSPMIHYQTPDLNWNISQLVITDKADKYLLMKDFAKFVEKEKIIAIICIFESWYTELDKNVFEKVGYQNMIISELKEKKEALIIDVVTKDLKIKNIEIPFKRNLFGKVIFSDIEYYEDNEMHYLEPILEVWRKK